jgi:uncharacterized protein YjaG (DUF416 family)
LKRDSGVPSNAPDTFDEYQQLTGETLKAWSPQQRLAFVAALAERWLQAYEKFSAAQGEGDPAVLRQIVGAVWDHLRGRPIAPTDANRFTGQINENAPDTEEFDQLSAWRALQACVIVGRALECCATTENAATAVQAVQAAFEAVLGDCPADLAGQRRAWKKVAVREEFGKQSVLLDAIGPILHFDDQTIATLRSGLGPAERRGRAGRTRPPAKKTRVDGDSIEGHRRAVRAYLKKSAAHRIAFVAALAERDLPLYQSFAAATGKGRPELLRSVLDAVWQAAKGKPIASAAFQELQTNLRRGALDPQDPEGWGAWSAWRLLELALACCGSTDNTESAEEAAVVAYECVAGRGSRNDPQIWKNMIRPGVWRRDCPMKIYDEILAQGRLLTRLYHAMPALDDQLLAALGRRS